MSNAPSKPRFKFERTRFTTKEVRMSRAAPDGSQYRSRFVLNPATGALEIPPDLRLKARKAIIREVRRMKLRLYLTQARLYFELLFLKAKSATLSMPGQFSGYCRNLGDYRHRYISPYKAISPN